MVSQSSEPESLINCNGCQFGNSLFSDLIYKFFSKLKGKELPSYIVVDQFRAALILRSLEITSGNKAHAAKLLGINRTTLHEMIKKKAYVAPALLGWSGRSYVIPREIKETTDI